MRRLRDTDPTTTLYRVRTLPLGLALGALTFASAGLVAKWPWYFALAAAVVVFVIVLLLPERLAAKSGEVAASLYTPQGASTPAVRQYSLADSLLQRGRIEEAAEAYRVLSADFPTDPEPQIRLARLLRDYTARYEDAARTYRQVLAIDGVETGTRIAITRELIELYTHRMRRPELALPYLARFAEEHPDHPAAGWARTQYKDIKQAMQTQHENG
ncbi:MAG TPA: tetratricopeptide repeat protein [Longimicrobiales bacterium]